MGAGTDAPRISMEGTATAAGRLITISTFFFFQAEDGIRDLTVTGVQTCALPISRDHLARGRGRHARPNQHREGPRALRADAGAAAPGAGRSYPQPRSRGASGLLRGARPPRGRVVRMRGGATAPPRVMRPAGCPRCS